VAIQRFVRERLDPAENHLEELDEVPGDIIEDMKVMGLIVPRSSVASALP
jgi:acyl-CoA dehydrogenase